MKPNAQKLLPRLLNDGADSQENNLVFNGINIKISVLGRNTRSVRIFKMLNSFESNS